MFDDRSGDLNQDFSKYFGILKNISSEERKYFILSSGPALVLSVFLDTQRNLVGDTHHCSESEGNKDMQD